MAFSRAAAAVASGRGRAIRKAIHLQADFLPADVIRSSEIGKSVETHRYGGHDALGQADEKSSPFCQLKSPSIILGAFPEWMRPTDFMRPLLLVNRTKPIAINACGANKPRNPIGERKGDGGYLGYTHSLNSFDKSHSQCCSANSWKAGPVEIPH